MTARPFTTAAIAAWLALAAGGAFADGTVRVDGPRGFDREVSRDVDRSAGTRSVERALTAGNGAEITSTGTLVCDGAGECTVVRTYTGPRGATGSADGTVTFGADGATGSATLERPDGTVAERDWEATGSRGDRAVSVETTGPRGTTTSEIERGFAPGDGTSSTRTTTGPNGGQRVVESGTTRLGRGLFARERSVETPRGTGREARRWIRIDR